jgi:DNA-binding transcriptional regulator YiaG
MKKEKGFTQADLEILGALTEFRDALKGGGATEKLTIRTMELDLQPHAYTADDVKRTRALLNASQGVFAQLLGVSVKTVRSWESGDREPCTMARRFLDEIRTAPDYWRARLGQAVKSKGPREVMS